MAMALLVILPCLFPHLSNNHIFFKLHLLISNLSVCLHLQRHCACPSYLLPFMLLKYSPQMSVPPGLWVPQEADSEMEICMQEVYWSMHGINIEREWGKQDWADGEDELWWTHNKGLSWSHRKFWNCSELLWQGIRPLYQYLLPLRKHT